jgi:hypothetical protein
MRTDGRTLKLIVTIHNLANSPNKRDIMRLIGCLLRWYGRVKGVVDAFMYLDIE